MVLCSATGSWRSCVGFNGYFSHTKRVYQLYINAIWFLAGSNTLPNLAIPVRCTSTRSRLLWLRRFFSSKPKRTHVRHNGYFSFSLSPRYICWIDTKMPLHILLGDSLGWLFLLNAYWWSFIPKSLTFVIGWVLAPVFLCTWIFSCPSESN